MKVNHQEDRLSNLPNEILVNILSCLETREAVRSGILSTRWKSVWASVPVLHLSQFDFEFKGKRSDADRERDEARFVNFMEQVLIARKLPCLEKISISGRSCDPNLLKSWLRAAVDRNANELDVNFGGLSTDTPCELTHNLFSNNKLVILNVCLGITINFLPDSSGFPNLKVLLLYCIKYRDDDSLPNLLSSCPILEDLSIECGSDDNLGTLNLISRSVKRLKLNEYFFEDSSFVDKVVFDAPAVESLEISTLETREFVVKDLSGLVDANFDALQFHSDSDVYKLLRGVSNVKFLSLDGSIVESIERSDAYDFPMFYNLTRLEIYGDDRFEENDWPADKRANVLQWELMLEILKCSPMLEHLTYKYGEWEYDYPCVKASDWDWDVPDCLVSSLKTVEFYYFSESDVERVRYLLLNARVLEKMTLKEVLYSNGLKSELCNAIFEKDKGSVSVTWSKREVVISFG